MEELRQLLRGDWERRHGALGRRAPAIGERQGGVLVAAAAETPKLPPQRRLRREVFARFLHQLDSRQTAGFTDRAAARAQVRRILDDLLAAGESPPLAAGERARLEEAVVAEICGFGPVDPLFEDPTVSDVLVNGPYEVWVDRFGRLEKTRVRFDDEEHLMRLLGRLVASQGRHLDEASPLVDVRLPDGSRLHALIPPLCAVPVVSIRRQRAIPFRLEELYACGTMSATMGELLSAAVGSGLNMVVSGGTGAGKTTLLNVLGSFIPPGERVVTIEETVELDFDHPHTISLEARLPNIEGRGEVTLRSLVRNALRMRPDRIIVGEVRGPEVFDMLQAMNTGHEGSLTTVHANSPADALRRLESLVHMGGFELPSHTIQELLGAAFHAIVQIARFLDGSRRITNIGEVAFEDGQLVARELFRYDAARPDGSGGRFVATGARPGFLPRLAAAGLPASIFDLTAAEPAAAEGD
jgi:pilus assembly protein CpaF